MGIAYPEILVLTDLGSGKTGISLELLSYFYHNKYIRKAFVFTPTNEVAEGWEDEIKKWGYTIPYVRLTNRTSKEKWIYNREFQSGIIIGTYAGISAMSSNLVDTLEIEKRRKRVIRPELIKELFDGVDAVIFDQCFPRGSLVDTPNGLIPIEKLNPGDFIVSSDFHSRKIEKIHIRQSKIFSRLYLSNGTTIEVTPDHPLFTNSGWICAGNTNGKYLYDKFAVQNLWKNIHKASITSHKKITKWILRTNKILQQILLAELNGLPRISQKIEQPDEIMGARKIIMEQRNPLQRIYTRKTKRIPYKIWAYFQIPWWQWYIDITANTVFADHIRPALDFRVCHSIEAKASRLSNLLQSRFWKSYEKVGYRSGWSITSRLWSKRKRQEKGIEITGIRVDRIENIQYNSPKNVYTLTIKDCPHFFAEGILVHNSTHLSKTSSLRFKVCKYAATKAQIRFGLAGRAFGRDPFVLWSQFFLVDKGKALGANPIIYREAFWRKKGLNFDNWVIRTRREPILAKWITASSIRYSIDECVDLPKKIPVTKECTFPDENWAYYEQIKEELIHSKGNFQECKNSFLRLRQISSGFIGFKDDDTGEKAQIEFHNNTKLDLLMELLEEVPEDKKVVIFHEFTWSGSRICQELSTAKYKHGWLWGGTKNWTEIKDSFNNDPEFRILVTSWKKGSQGLNLQKANYVFFFESPVSPIDRYECEGRIYRTGQIHKSFIYDLILRDSVDETIRDFHKTGNNLWKSLVENPQKVLRPSLYKQCSR